MVVRRFSVGGGEVGARVRVVPIVVEVEGVLGLREYDGERAGKDGGREGEERWRRSTGLSPSKWGTGSMRRSGGSAPVAPPRRGGKERKGEDKERRMEGKERRGEEQGRDQGQGKGRRVEEVGRRPLADLNTGGRRASLPGPQVLCRPPSPLSHQIIKYLYKYI